MPALDKPMMGRRARPDDLAEDEAARDLAYEYRRKVGNYLRRLRVNAGLTQAEVAKVLGIGHTAVSALELGRSVVSPEKYTTLADLFGVNKAEMGKFLLRYTNPWLYALIYGERSADLRHDLSLIPERIGPRGEPQDGKRP